MGYLIVWSFVMLEDLWTPAYILSSKSMQSTTKHGIFPHRKFIWCPRSKFHYWTFNSFCFSFVKLASLPILLSNLAISHLFIRLIAILSASHYYRKLIMLGFNLQTHLEIYEVSA